MTEVLKNDEIGKQYAPYDCGNWVKNDNYVLNFDRYKNREIDLAKAKEICYERIKKERSGY